MLVLLCVVQVTVMAKSGLGRRVVGEPFLLPVVDKEGKAKATWTPPSSLFSNPQDAAKGVRFVLLVKPLNGGVLPFAFSNALKAVQYDD